MSPRFFTNGVRALAVLLLSASGLKADGGSPAIADFENGELPANVSGNRIIEALDVGAPIRVENGVAILGASFDESKQGLLLSADSGDVLYEELSSLSIALRFRAEPVSRTPVFFQRLRNSRTQPGFFAFYNQSNIENEGTMKGSFRFTATGADRVPKTVASSALWTLAPGEWYHVAVTFERGIVRFYLDGLPLGEPQEMYLETIPPLQSSAKSLRIGQGFTGAVDDVVVWPNRVLSDAEVQTLHEKGPKSLSTP